MEPKKAHSKVQYAVDSGKLNRPVICEVCGFDTSKNPKMYRNPWTGKLTIRTRVGVQIVAHHPDYNKPLEVTWVCRRCHSKIHKGTQNGV